MHALHRKPHQEHSFQRPAVKVISEYTAGTIPVSQQQIHRATIEFVCADWLNGTMTPNMRHHAKEQWATCHFHHSMVVLHNAHKAFTDGRVSVPAIQKALDFAHFQRAHGNHEVGFGEDKIFETGLPARSDPLGTWKRARKATH